VSPSFLSAFFCTLNPLFFSSLATGARRQHRGPRTGGKKSLDKQSYQRRERLFNSDVPNDDSDMALYALPTEASRDRRTKEEIDAVLPWVRWFQLFTLCLPFLTLFFKSPG
jgi:hypothetical protein